LLGPSPKIRTLKSLLPLCTLSLYKTPLHLIFSIASSIYVFFISYPFSKYFFLFLFIDVFLEHLISSVSPTSLYDNLSKHIMCLISSQATLSSRSSMIFMNVFKINIISSYQIDDLPKVCNQHQILKLIYIYFSLYKLICISDFFLSFGIIWFNYYTFIILYIYEFKFFITEWVVSYN